MDLAHRVARRFIAEKLTKEWLMGVRRGWLALMKPSISSWDDVERAVGKLLAFENNLREQIRYVRPGAKRILDKRFDPKLNKAFDQLETALKESRDRARHWRQVDEEPETYGRGTFKKEDGEHMFRLFRNDFSDATNTSEPIRGGGGRHRPLDLTELMDRVLKLLREDAEAIRRHDEDNPEAPFEAPSAFTEFALGNMKVVVDDRTVSAAQIDLYARYLIEARKKLESKGFGKVWYGTVFIRCESCGGVNPNTGGGVGGNYPSGPDVVNIFSRPGSFIVRLMAHELGHRYWFRKMTSGQRAKFESLVKVRKGPRPDEDTTLPKSPAMQEWEESYMKSPNPVLPVSEYGKSNIDEAFAEAFESYIMEEGMNRDQLESFRSVLSSTLVERVASRYAASLPITPEYVAKILAAPGLSSNAPDAVTALTRLEKSLQYGNIEPFPVADLGEYLRGRSVPEDEVALVLAVRVRAPAKPKEINFVDAFLQFERETGASTVPDMSFENDPQAGKAVLGWLSGWKKLKPAAREMWTRAVRKVHFGSPRGSEDASWSRSALLLTVNRTADPKTRATQLTHELGHAFEELHNLNGFSPPWGQPPFISDYAEFRPNVEDIAESFRAFVDEPSLLRRKCPEKFEALKKLV